MGLAYDSIRRLCVRGDKRELGRNFDDLRKLVLKLTARGVRVQFLKGAYLHRGRLTDG